jgi:sugar transferase (PEP-CTERM system associated)
MLRLFKQYYPVRNAIFALCEGFFIFSSVAISCLLLIDEVNFNFDINTVLKAFLITFICQVCLYYNDLYDLKVTDTLLELGIRLFQALGVSAILMAIFYLIFPTAIIQQGIFIMTIALVIVFIVSWRILYTHVLGIGLFNQKIMIVGSSDIAKEIFAQIMVRRDCGYEIACVISKEKWDVENLPEVQLIEPDKYNSLYELACQKKVNKIIVALKEKRNALPIAALLDCRVRGIDVLEGNSFYEMLTGKLIVEAINPSWLIFSQGFQKPLIKRFIKRTIDLTLSFSMLVLLSPLIILAAVLIKLDSKGPILFSQERVGQNKKPYMVYKFRSMREDAEEYTGPVWAQSDDNRITRMGHFIRKWRVDEIPQLYNVLKGEMSFVGPRPEREHFVQELEAIIPYYKERFSVKPGLTGWAQVCYGYGASVEDAVEKLNYELFYIKNMSILMDLMIVARTVRTVLFGHGR